MKESFKWNCCYMPLRSENHFYLIRLPLKIYDTTFSRLSANVRVVVVG